MPLPKTVVISCAGMGSRLGMGLPKALLTIGDKPIICHHLDQLREVEDVRVVVGYEYQKVIDLVRAVRDDVLFVFNHQFRTTNTLASLCLGAVGAHELVVSLDGDLLVHPDDLHRFLAVDEQILGYCKPYSDEPVLCDVERRGDENWVTGFSRSQGDFEWTGLAMVERENLKASRGYVFECLAAHLPYRGMLIDCREIDTPHDLEQARSWSAHALGGGRS